MTNQEAFETARAGDWIAETFSRSGDVFSITGKSTGYSSFADCLTNGQSIFYAAFDENDNREAGLAVWDSGAKTLTPVEIHATLVGGAFISGDPDPLQFTGGGTITGTFNATAFNALWSHVWDKGNPHEVTAEQVEQNNENNLGDNVQDALDNIGDKIVELDGNLNDLSEDIENIEFEGAVQNHVSGLPPANPSQGDMWTDVGVSGEQYVWEGEFWVSVTGGGGGGGGSDVAGVTTFNNRSGAVTLTTEDVEAVYSGDSFFTDISAETGNNTIERFGDEVWVTSFKNDDTYVGTKIGNGLETTGDLSANNGTFVGNVGIGTTGSLPSNGKLNVGGGRSYFAADSEPYAIGVSYNSSSSNMFIGSPGVNEFEVSYPSGIPAFYVGASGAGITVGNAATEALTIDPSGDATFSGNIEGNSVLVSSPGQMSTKAQISFDSAGSGGVSWHQGCTMNGAKYYIDHGDTEAFNFNSQGYLATFKGAVSASNITSRGVITQDGSPVIDAKGLIKTLSTLRNATKDETTLEGMRDALADAIGGLIESLEHEISTMPAEGSE